MEPMKKIKRAAAVLLAAVSVILLGNACLAVPAIFHHGALGAGAADGAARAVVGAVNVTYVMGTLALSLVLLFSVKKDETPFKLKNVKLLKGIAAALLVYEPYGLAAQWVLNRPAPLDSVEPVFTELFFTQGGFVFAAGLVVYCISLVFEHGISLQKQFDETL